MGKQELERLRDLPTSWVFGMDPPLCDALWVMDTSMLWRLCLSKPTWSSWRSCLRNRGTEGFAVEMVSCMFKDFLVLVSPDFLYSQQGETATPQGDLYAGIGTKVTVRDIFVFTGYCGILND